ncbi:nitrophenyl compound nitroreductase subunit ArsF family protein [Lutibacter sp. TH_r2]|uniref:nitrophenyl compound nitroreductase subunit ArsF family protein n=1 Tax=Lutibacter sp. TH_r2 TaxID=3082083 RepID=UPI002954A03C|nr:nitrophenyl compound nitroreductase subunit ArsF family protein [Lutibacter sp. TH_r2]MDV7186286.1 nitrophenyl compound nitroreductase subunit ArsF family protein [Lutibacter sp. TH_r2]
MKNIKILIVTIISLVIVSCGNKKESKAEETIAKNNVIEVIDFHSTHRCITCKAIESNSKYTLETYFAKELAAGKIKLKVIDVDLEENYKIAEKFEATGTALFLNVVNKGKEEQIDLTEFAFATGKNNKEFSEQLKAKIEEQLNKL